MAMPAIFQKKEKRGIVLTFLAHVLLISLYFMVPRKTYFSCAISENPWPILRKCQHHTSNPDIGK